jgi:hypothetical protein
VDIEVQCCLHLERGVGELLVDSVECAIDCTVKCALDDALALFLLLLLEVDFVDTLGTDFP